MDNFKEKLNQLIIENPDRELIFVSEPSFTRLIDEFSSSFNLPYKIELDEMFVPEHCKWIYLKSRNPSIEDEGTTPSSEAKWEKVIVVYLD